MPPYAAPGTNVVKGLILWKNPVLLAQKIEV